MTIVAEQPGIDLRKIPPGLSIQRASGPSPPRRPPPGGARSNIERAHPQHLPRLVDSRPLAPVRNPAMMNFPVIHRNSRRSLPHKRALPLGFGPAGFLPRKLPRFSAQPVLPGAVSAATAFPPLLPKRSLLCRLCLQLSTFGSPIQDRPEVIQSLKFVLGYEINLETDHMNGYPGFVCRKCATAILTFSDYKRLFESAQQRLSQCKPASEPAAVDLINDIAEVGSDPFSTSTTTDPDYKMDAIMPGRLLVHHSWFCHRQLFTCSWFVLRKD